MQWLLNPEYSIQASDVKTGSIRRCNKRIHGYPHSIIFSSKSPSETKAVSKTSLSQTYTTQDRGHRDDPFGLEPHISIDCPTQPTNAKTTMENAHETTLYLNTPGYLCTKHTHTLHNKRQPKPKRTLGIHITYTRNTNHTRGHGPCERGPFLRFLQRPFGTCMCARICVTFYKPKKKYCSF